MFEEEKETELLDIYVTANFFFLPLPFLDINWNLQK